MLPKPKDWKGKQANGSPRQQACGPSRGTSRAHLTVESFQGKECLQLAWWGREFLSRGEQNTHLHKLAFQMGMSLMQDLTGTE